MRSNRIRELLFASFLATAALAAAPATAQQPYDGLWQVTVVTKTGSCDAQTTSTVTVSDGKVSGSGAPVSGTVGPGDLCESRSMVHMRTVNSVATPDRGNGMGHQLVYRAAVDGKRPVSKTQPNIRTLRPHAAADICSRRVFYGLARRSGEPRPVRGRYAGMAGKWAGGGTVTLDDGSSERIRCRATYQVAGPNMDMSLTCASDAYKFNLDGQCRRPGRRDRRAVERNQPRHHRQPVRAAAAAATSRSRPSPPASTPTSRSRRPATSRPSASGPTASSGPPIFRCRNRPARGPVAPIPNRPLESGRFSFARRVRACSPMLARFGFASFAAVSLMVFAISRACSLLKAKSCTPLWVVSDSTMMSGCFSGQPVAKAVTKSAEVDRLCHWAYPVSCCDARLKSSGT